MPLSFVYWTTIPKKTAKYIIVYTYETTFVYRKDCSSSWLKNMRYRTKSHINLLQMSKISHKHSTVYILALDETENLWKFAIDIRCTHYSYHWALFSSYSVITLNVIYNQSRRSFYTFMMIILNIQICRISL